MQWAQRNADTENSENSREELLAIAAEEQKIESLRQQISEASQNAEASLLANIEPSDDEMAALEELEITVIDQITSLFKSGLSEEAILEQFGEHITGVMGEILRSKSRNKKRQEKLEALLGISENARKKIETKLEHNPQLKTQLVKASELINKLSDNLRQNITALNERVAKPEKSPRPANPQDLMRRSYELMQAITTKLNDLQQRLEKTPQPRDKATEDSLKTITALRKTNFENLDKLVNAVKNISTALNEKVVKLDKLPKQANPQEQIRRIYDLMQAMNTGLRDLQLQVENNLPAQGKTTQQDSLRTIEALRKTNLEHVSKLVKSTNDIGAVADIALTAAKDFAKKIAANNALVTNPALNKLQVDLAARGKELQGLAQLQRSDLAAQKNAAGKVQDIQLQQLQKTQLASAQTQSAKPQRVGADVASINKFKQAGEPLRPQTVRDAKISEVVKNYPREVSTIPKDLRPASSIVPPKEPVSSMRPAPKDAVINSVPKPSNSVRPPEAPKLGRPENQPLRTTAPNAGPKETPGQSGSPKPSISAGPGPRLPETPKPAPGSAPPRSAAPSMGPKETPAPSKAPVPASVGPKPPETPKPGPGSTPPRTPAPSVKPPETSAPSSPPKPSASVRPPETPKTGPGNPPSQAPAPSAGPKETPAPTIAPTSEPTKPPAPTLGPLPTPPLPPSVEPPQPTPKPTPPPVIKCKDPCPCGDPCGDLGVETLRPSNNTEVTNMALATAARSAANEL